MKKLWQDKARIPVLPRDVRLARVWSAEEARQVELEERVRAGYERGRIEGERALGEQLIRQRQETQALANGILESLRNALPQVTRDTEQTLVVLALEIARKIVTDLPVTAPMVEATVREALEQVENAAELTVLLHPADLELLQQLASPLLEPAAEPSRTIQFRGTPEVSRGGCLVQTRFGAIDARRESKFELLKRSLLP